MPFSRHCLTLLCVEGMLYSLGAKGRKGKNREKVEVRVCLNGVIEREEVEGLCIFLCNSRSS